MTKTFSQFIGDVLVRHIDLAVPMGTAFVDELYASDRSLLGNALATFRDDPMGKDTVSPECIAFVERNW